MLILKQSTAIDIRMGPFVDATNGVTPETGVTLAAADQAEVLKANGAATVAMAGTFAAVTGADGWYDYTCATGDVDTTGEVVFVVQDADVCLPVFVRAMVIDALTYDALYADTPTAFDASGRVDVGEWLGTAVTASGGVPDVNVQAIDTGAITAAAIATDALTSAKIDATFTNEIWAKVVETVGTVTAQEAMSLILAAVAGVTSGGGATIKDGAGTNTRIAATIDGSNNRTAMSYTPSS